MIPNLSVAETYIINASKGGDKSKIPAIKESLLVYKDQIEYNCNMFIEQYGSKLDVERNDAYHKFMKIQNENYSKITRLFRVMQAYNV